MPGLHSIRTEERKLADAARDPQIVALAELVIKLADQCIRIESKVEDSTRRDQSRRK